MQLQFSYKSTVVSSFRRLHFYPGPIEESRCTTDHSKKQKKHCRIFRKQHHYQHLSQGAVTNRGEVAVPFVMSQMGTHPYKFAEREIMSFSNLPGVRREGRRSIKKQNKNVAHSFNRTLKEAQHKRDNTDGNNSAVCVHIYEYKREKAYKATRRKKKKPHKGE